MTSQDLGEFPDERTIAILRGLIAEQHRKLHIEKHQCADVDERDSLSEQMRELENISGNLARWL